METKRIIVYDYRNGIDKPKKYNVDAYCVGGEYGILAFFTIDDMFYQAHGDDGHWQVIYVCHVNWISKIKKTVAEVPEIQA